MNEQNYTVAVDFGTTNSYFCKCPEDQLSPVGVDFGFGRDGMPTAILYREGKSPLIGSWALHEYGEATPKERATYQLRTQFKPDIAAGGSASRHAEDFLMTVLLEAEKKHIALLPESSQAIFGVPSESGLEFKQAIAGIAQSTGFGQIRTVDEPKGALLYHLWHKDISPSEAQQGVLVIDFGGGTCDFALMRNLEVLHSWGDMELGGRLFDDLFYQWFVDQNPQAIEAIDQAGDFYYVYAYLCREAKEFFSLTMARDRSETVNKSIGRYGTLKGMTWQIFTERASAYQPSEALHRYLEDVGIRIDRLSQGQPIDLIDWFQTCLTEGLASVDQNQSPIGRVILAGGSSQWPFVFDTITETLGCRGARLMRSDRPYAAISEGLAILPALQHSFDTIRTNLRNDLPGFCQDRIGPLIKKITDTYAAEIAADVTVELFDGKIRPVLEAFRKQGGTVASLKQRTALDVEAFDAPLRAIVAQRADLLKTGLTDKVKAEFAQWLGSYNLSVPEAALSDGQGFSVDDTLLERHMPDLYGDIVETVGWFVVTVVAGIGGSISGGGGMVLIYSGPVGWLIGAILAGIVAVLAVSYGKTRAKQLAENWTTPAWVAKRVLTDHKIAKAREQFHAKINDQLSAQCVGLHREFQERISDIAEQQIEALSEITQL
ncbi:MAG: Hsp70 family protein [Phycisphaeraceae bacterium]|nr:Hsp70 family protein [Phycisphaeraceae bacterium]